MKMIIRHHPTRSDYKQYLSEKLPTAEWCVDHDNNAMHTFLKSMLMAGNTSTVHMEDDILLTTNFQSKLLTAIESKPNTVIQFFSMRKADIETGSRYDYGRNFMMNQCFYLPTSYSLKIYNYYQTWERKEEHPTGYDILIADFLKSRKEKYWIHVPSLVQHLDTQSLINPKRSRSRQSLTFQV